MGNFAKHQLKTVKSTWGPCASDVYGKKCAHGKKLTSSSGNKRALDTISKSIIQNWRSYLLVLTHSTHTERAKYKLNRKYRPIWFSKF